jgi:tetratricopeptide (TPR) repeat protein
MTRPLVALVFGILALFVVARPASAEDAETKAARRHFSKGKKLFALGRFEEALGHYEKAYEAKPIPAFMFNIAQCHRNLGHLDEAIFSYRRYLTEQPDAEDRAEVEQQIDELEEERDKRNASKVVVTDPPPEVRKPTGPTKKPIYARWWFWGGVAAVAGAGAGTYLLTRGGDAPPTDLGNVVFD